MVAKVDKSKVCEARVACIECKTLTPNICGNRHNPVFTECYEGEMMPSSRCLKTVLHIGEC